MNDFDDIVRSTRAEFEPSRADRERVKRQLAAQIAGVGVAASLTASTAHAAKASGLLAGQSLLGLSKLFFGSMFVTCAGIGAITVATRTWSGSRAEAPPVAARASTGARSVTATNAPRGPDAAPTSATVTTTNATVDAAASAGVALAPEVAPAPDEATPMRNVEPRSGGPLAAPAPSASSGSELEAELADLRAARQANTEGDQVRALRLLDELDRRYPDGRLLEERAALRAMASCAAGVDGATRARAFVQRYPASIYAAKVRRACASGGEDGEHAAPASSATFTDVPEVGH
jgi:hypothetical protein